MSFNLGGWNRLPFNRGSIEEIRLEVIFDSGLGMEGDDIIVDDALSIAFDSSLDYDHYERIAQPKLYHRSRWTMDVYF